VQACKSNSVHLSVRCRFDKTRCTKREMQAYPPEPLRLHTDKRFLQWYPQWIRESSDKISIFLDWMRRAEYFGTRQPDDKTDSVRFIGEEFDFMQKYDSATNYLGFHDYMHRLHSYKSRARLTPIQRYNRTALQEGHPEWAIVDPTINVETYPYFPPPSEIDGVAYAPGDAF